MLMMFDMALAFVSLALAASAWLFPDLVWYFKVILTLVVLIVYLFIYCVRILFKLRDVQKKREEVEQHHNALAIQFDEKIKLEHRYIVQERRYKRAFQNFSLVLHLACQNTKDAKFKDIYKAFLIAQDELNDGGTRHE